MSADGGIVGQPGDGERVRGDQRVHRIVGDLPELELIDLRFGPDVEGVPHLIAMQPTSIPVHLAEAEAEFALGDEVVRASLGLTSLRPSESLTACATWREGETTDADDPCGERRLRPPAAGRVADASSACRWQRTGSSAHSPRDAVRDGEWRIGGEFRSAPPIEEPAGNGGFRLERPISGPSIRPRCGKCVASERTAGRPLISPTRNYRTPAPGNSGQRRAASGTLGAVSSPPDANRLQPDHLPTPFSAADIRDGCPVGARSSSRAKRREAS